MSPGYPPMTLTLGWHPYAPTPMTRCSRRCNGVRHGAPAYARATPQIDQEAGERTFAIQLPPQRTSVLRATTTITASRRFSIFATLMTYVPWID